MGLLLPSELTELVDAIIGSGIDTVLLRGSFFQQISPFYRAALPSPLPPMAQVISDVNEMNRVERLTNGDIPLQTYLHNVVQTMFGAPVQQEIVRRLLNLVTQRAAGAAVINPVHFPEIQQVLIHKEDDTVPHGFMKAGLRVAESVIKVLVPAFENGLPKTLPSGAQVIGNGTGWLLTDSLLITNHHVINARKQGEASAAEADLRLQGRSTTILYDFDSEIQTGTVAAAISLEAWEPQLDYAILRIPQIERAGIKIAPTKISSVAEPIPVNIIQHPGGHSKRFGIRNNLVSASTETDLRYFTDTESGSSGGPVMNDQWEAVALHRGAVYVTNVQFQGKSTAFVNVGTHLASILADLRLRFPAIAAEIGS